MSNYTVQLDGVDYLRLENLTISRDNTTSNQAVVIDFQGGVNNNFELRNCYIWNDYTGVGTSGALMSCLSVYSAGA